MGLWQTAWLKGSRFTLEGTLDTPNRQSDPGPSGQGSASAAPAERPRGRSAILTCTGLSLGALVLLQAGGVGGMPGSRSMLGWGAESTAWIRLDWALWLLLFVPAFALAAYLERRRGPSGPVSTSPVATGEVLLGILLAALALLLVSSAAGDPWFYFFRWVPGEGGAPPLKSHLVRWCLAGAVLSPLFLVRRVPVWVPMAVVVLVCTTTCLREFHQATGGLPPARDDHPSFMFRLWTLGKTLPGLVHYNPYWNAGKADAYALASGAVTPGVLLWPLWKWVPVHEGYGLGLAILFLVLAPILAGFSVRLAGGSRVAALSGAVLSLGVTRNGFLWLLHFGTVGFSLCVLFLLPVSASLYRILWRGGDRRFSAVVLVAGMLLFLAWPAGVLLIPALVLAVLASARMWTRRTLLLLTGCAVVAALLYAPFLIGFLRHTAAAGLVKTSGTEGGLMTGWAAGWLELAKDLRRGNPLILFLGVLGVWFLPSRGIRVFYGATLLALTVLAGWGETWLPGLGLDRADIALFVVALIPAALGLAAVLENPRMRWAPVRAGVLVLVALSGLNSARFFGNQATPRYHVTRDYMAELIDWIRAETPEDARILFAGPAVHAYGGGHVAYLPVLTGREMMACDYYAFSPRLVEPEYPPTPFRESKERVLEFLDLYNVSYVVTYHTHWIRFFDGEPDVFSFVKAAGASIPYRVYRVNREPQPFYRGRGAVNADLNLLDVRVEDSSQEAVIKYHWADGLSVQAPAEIFPVQVRDGIRFIGIRAGGEDRVQIRFRDQLMRGGTTHGE